MDSLDLMGLEAINFDLVVGTDEMAAEGDSLKFLRKAGDTFGLVPTVGDSFNVEVEGKKGKMGARF